MTFSISRLVGNRAVISGTDKHGVNNQLVVDTTQWDEVNANTAFDQAKEAFESAVGDFFAPLTAAAEQMQKTLKRPADPVGFVVLREGVEATPGQAEQIITLSHDSVLIRLVEQGNHDRLMWVGDSLEVLEADTPLPGVDLDEEMAAAVSRETGLSTADGPFQS